MAQVLKPLALLAAVLVGTNASPLSDLQARTSIASGSLIESNCAVSNVTAGFCDFQYLSYAGFEQTGINPARACDAFNKQCDTYASNGTTIARYCTPDRANKVITASCIKIDCLQRTAFSYTGKTASAVPSKKKGVSAFYSTSKCPDGEGFCSPKTAISHLSPVQFNDKDNKVINKVCRRTPRT